MKEREMRWKKKRAKNKSYLQIKMMMVMSADQPEPCGETKKYRFQLIKEFKQKYIEETSSLLLPISLQLRFFFQALIY